MCNRILLLLAAGLCLIHAVHAQNDATAGAQHILLGQVSAQAGGSGSKPNRHPQAQWFPDAGLGLFIHFGIASVHGGIDLSWSMYKNKSWEDGEISPAQYWALADQWNPVRFDADEIVRAARQAGFRYIVFVTKHHDGYTLWPSKYGSLGVKQKMGGRDMVREMVDACHKYDLKTGLYYSPPDWFFDARYMNWDFSKKTILDVHYRRIPELPARPEGHDRQRREMAANHVRELLTEYGRIDMMWFDGGKGEITNDEIRRLQPGIVINRRNGEVGDYGDSEGRLPAQRFEGWFEANDPCWPSRWWSYSTSDRMDSGAEVIEKLVIMRAWGGNFLANAGPMADGTMPAEALAAWERMGEWMKHSGESVFDTKGGPFPEQANQPVTVKGDTWYMHAFPNFHKRMILEQVEKAPEKIVLLRTGNAIPFTYENGVLSFQIPPAWRTRMVDTVKIVF